MSKMIDGNALIMSLTDWWYSSFGQEETEESKAIKTVVDEVEKYVDGYPTYREWIPVSERLPEKHGQYLCNVPLDEETAMLYILIYGKPMLPMNCGSGVGWYHTDSEGDYYMDGVTAWMPLPEPWKGGAE